MRTLLYTLIFSLALAPVCAKGWRVHEQIVPDGISKEFVAVEYDGRERNGLIIKASGYRLKIDLVGPKITQFQGGGRSANFLLAPTVLQAEVGGQQLTSGTWDKKARSNVWRHGPYYQEVHILDFPLCSSDGKEGPATGEIVFHCYPDKFHLQAIVRPKDDAKVLSAKIDFKVIGKVTTPVPDAAGTSRSVFTSTRGISGIVFHQGMKPTVTGGADRSMFVVERDKAEAGAVSLGFAWLSADSAQAAEEAAILECRPLQAGYITVTDGGGFEGYDRLRGHYVLRTGWSPPAGFEANWANPNRYLGVSFKVIGDEHTRRLYFKNYSFSGGAVQAGVLTDPFGFPVPIPVQTCKNFGGEMEESDDTPFSETYFPLQIEPRQVVELQSLHLFQNWGNHILKQVSSIRFFEHYYHLSTGATETTCYVPFTKTARKGIGYTIADYRGMSQLMWPDQPQHDHVALIGFLQYLDGEHWRQLRYTGTDFHFISPNFANFTMNYMSDDDKIKASVEVFEIPQADETRSFVKLRYDVLERVQISGDARHNLRLLNACTDITRNRYSKVAFLDSENKPMEVDLRYDGTYTLEGAGLGGDFPFVCLYGSDKGNNAFIIRRFDGKIGGRELKELAISTIGYEDGVADQFLTTRDRQVELQQGDYLEAEIILMPYGTASSDWQQPNRERTYYGTEAPKLETERGFKVSDFPATIDAMYGVARFSVNGGQDYLPLIVRGMPSYKAPMLWRDYGPSGAEAKKLLPSQLAAAWDFLDQQVVGNDWYQVSGEGPYDFVFLTRVRSGQKHKYMVTQAQSDADIKSIRLQDGQLLVESDRPARMTITGPRLFIGLDNRLESDNPVIVSSGRAISAVSAPFFAGVANGRAEISDIGIAGERIRFRVEGSGRLSLTFHGLQPGGEYKISVDKEPLPLTADGGGAVNTEIPIKGKMEMVFTPR